MVAGGDHTAQVHLHAHFNSKYTPESSNARRLLEDAPTKTADPAPTSGSDTSGSPPTKMASGSGTSPRKQEHAYSEEEFNSNSG